MPSRLRDCPRRLAAAGLAAVALVLGLPASAGAGQRPVTIAIPTPTVAAYALSVQPGDVRLGWRAVPGAASYSVTRDGRVVAGATRLPARSVGWVDHGVGQLRQASYVVRARLAAGGAVVVSRPIPVVTPSTAACDRYASDDEFDARDGNPGTAAAPVRTVARLAAMLAPGQVGCLRGTFVGDVTIARGGSPGQPVVLRSVPGTRARVAGRMWISDAADDVVVEGLDLVGRSSTQLPSPTVEGDRVWLLRNDITRLDTGICVILGSIRGYGTAVATVLDGNRIHGCGPSNNHRHGVYLESTRGARITDNVIYGNADRGIQLYPDAQRTTIARNVIHGNGEGVIFSGADGFTSSGNIVRDNIVTGANRRYDIEYYWDPSSPVGTRNAAVGNCVFGGHDGTIATPLIGLAAYGNLVADPRYAAAGLGDFRLAPGSPCLDRVPAGTALRPLAPLA